MYIVYVASSVEGGWINRLVNVASRRLSPVSMASAYALLVVLVVVAEESLERRGRVRRAARRPRPHRAAPRRSVLALLHN